jgi:hypothetical protein
MAQKKLTDKQCKEVLSAYEKHGFQTKAADAIGMNRGTFLHRYAEAVKRFGDVKPDSKLQIEAERTRKVSRDKLKETTGLLNQSEKELIELRKTVDMLTGVSKVKPRKIVTKQKESDHEAVPHLLASDWHCEEQVLPEQLGGIYNKYTPDIFKTSADAFFRNGLTLIKQQAPYIKIKECVLIFGGDMITNSLHEENKHTNFMGPAKATALAYESMLSGVDFLLNSTEYKWTIICKPGNHGRATKEMFSAISNDYSWEYLIYKMMANRYQNEPRVNFVLDESYHTYFNCYGFIERIHHGDGVKFGGGVGGITIPINKAISAWNQATVADLDVMGHFHQYTDGENFIVNGSLIGVNPWGLKMKFKPEPPKQTMYIIDSKYGKTARFPIFIRDNKQ